MADKKHLSFFTIISTVICVVFVCEAAAPAAAIGNQQFFWWIFLILTFLVPYGLAVAELGTAYESDGGIIDWIRDGLGDKWAARAAYYYWVNYPFWIASLATLFPYIMTTIFGFDFESNVWITLAVELVFTWIVTFMAFSPVSDSEWVLNGGAIIKVAVAVLVGCIGIWFASKNGFATDMPLTLVYQKGMENGRLFVNYVYKYHGKTVLTNSVEIPIKIDKAPYLIYETVKNANYVYFGDIKTGNDRYDALITRVNNVESEVERIGLIDQLLVALPDNYMLHNNLGVIY